MSFRSCTPKISLLNQSLETSTAHLRTYRRIYRISSYLMRKVMVLLLQYIRMLSEISLSVLTSSLGTCNIQMLLATDFNHIPHDEATMNDLRGATRVVFRNCVLNKKVGGVISKNGRVPAPTMTKDIESSLSNSVLGRYGNIEVVVYATHSVYAKNQILKNSQDPLARSIATQELLELMNVVIAPVPSAAPTV